MANLYIVKQINRNAKMVKQYTGITISKIWAFIDKISTNFANTFNKEIVEIITKVSKKHKKFLQIFLGIFLFFALIIGLFMASFKSAGSREQGFQINYTEGVLKQAYYTNDWKYTGLNGYMMLVPKQKILIQFTNSQQSPSQQSQTHQVYEALQARVVEGTKLIIEAAFQCRIVIEDKKDVNMKKFFDLYGFEKTPGRQSEKLWMTYLKQKIRNLVIQTIGKYSFYNTTNKQLKQEINTNFISINSKDNILFPFKINLLTMAINYPEQSFSANNTLGIQLLKAKSYLNQLNNQYRAIQEYIQANNDSLSKIFTKNAQILSAIDSKLLGIYSYDGWNKGLNLIKDITNKSTFPGTPSVNMEKFMWLYFNNLYNETYRQEKLISRENSSNFERNLQIQQLFIE